MILLIDTLNNYIISRHQTVKAAVIAAHKHNKAVKRANGQHSYIPTAIKCTKGNDISEDIVREEYDLYQNH